MKNLGMGCTPSVGKIRQHRTVGLEIDVSKCVGCGKCKDACPKNLPDIIKGKARNTSTQCMRCPICIDTCPMEAIRFVEKENLCKALASAAYGVLSTFKPSKVMYVSFAKDTTQYCDCLPNPGQILLKDVGVFASDSPVSIDAAFLQSIDYKVLNDASKVDCMLQVEEAKVIGITGELKPKIEVLSQLA